MSPSLTAPKSTLIRATLVLLVFAMNSFFVLSYITGRSTRAPFLRSASYGRPAFWANGKKSKHILRHMATIEHKDLYKNYDMKNPEEAAEYRRKNLETKKLVDAGKLVSIKAYVHPALRAQLRLSKREKVPKLFLAPGEHLRAEAVAEKLEEAVAKLKGFPYRLGVRPDPSAPALRLVSADGGGLAEAFAAAGPGRLQVFVEPDPDWTPPPPPPYLAGLPDPALSPSLTPISFFSFKALADPEDFRVLLQELWRPFGAYGRVYVAKEGLNAQMAVPTIVLSQFEEACRTLPELANIYINKDDPLTQEEYAEIKPFKGLHIRVRAQVVADGGPAAVGGVALDWEDPGPALGPLAWHRALEEREASGAVVLDCRNKYETDVGYFEGATPLNTTYFRQSWEVIDEMLKDHPKDKPVMMYCTGGIRCIKVGAYVKQKLGFQNVQRLDGGIVNYAQAVAQQAEAMASKFKGKNYVFDQRLGTDITEDVFSECDICGTKCNSHTNCANTKCHVRFLQCAGCHADYAGCCSRGCQHQADLRAGGAAAAARGGAPPLRLQPLPAEERAALQDRWLEPQPFENARLNRVFDTVLEEYAEKFSSEEPAELAAVRRATEEAMPWAAHMVSGHLQGALLTALARLTGARRVLEVGTFTGYSALCFARGLPPADGDGDGGGGGGGRVVTLEVDAEAAAVARKNFENDPHGLKVQLKHGKALDIFPELVASKEQYDIIFIDGDKKKYIEYYDLILQNGLLSKGGIILADNVLYKGGVIPHQTSEEAGEEFSFSEDKKEKRQQKIAESLHAFNKHVKADKRTEQVLLPFRDGLTVIRLKDGENKVL